MSPPTPEEKIAAMDNLTQDSGRVRHGRKSALRRALRRLTRNPAVICALIVLAIVLFFAAISPFLPIDPYKSNFGARLRPPSSFAWLGTDQLGRDLLVRIIAGSRIALMVGFISVSIGLVIGGLLGLLSGMLPNTRIDAVLMRCMDIILAFPWLLIVIAVIALLGSSIRNAMIAIGITLIPEFARLTRSLVLATHNQDFVLAAKSLGASRLRIAFRHVMPHCVAQLVVLSTVRMGRAILSEAGLSYLGLGVQPPHPSWGSMIASGQNYLLTAPHASLVPGLAVLIIVMALNIAGDGLRDALDPKGVVK